LALVYFALIVKTFHRYGDALDHEWVRTVNEWAKEGAGAQRNQQLLPPSGPPPPPWMGPTVPPPQTPPWGAPTWGMPGMVPPPPWGSSPYNGPGPSPVIPFIPPQHADADPWTTSPPNFFMPSPRSPYASGSPAAGFTEQPPQDSPARDQNPNPTFIIADTNLNPRSPTLPTEDGEGSGMDEGADSGDFGMMEQDSPIPRASTNVVDHLNPFEAGADCMSMHHTSSWLFYVTRCRWTSFGAVPCPGRSCSFAVEPLFTGSPSQRRRTAPRVGHALSINQVLAFGRSWACLLVERP
jgi:hypothetical protein